MRYFIFVLLAYVKCQAMSYDEKRTKIIELESRLTPGGNTILNEKETLVNNCLMKHKFDEIDYGFNNPQYYNFSHHFFTYKDRIKDSKVYKIIKAMPKGAVLHVHDTAMLGPDYMVNLTYMDHLYVCFDKQGMTVKFSSRIPNITCDVDWQLMSDARAAADNVTKFDQEIRKSFTIVVDNPDVVYPTIKEPWAALGKHFRGAHILLYKPVWEQHIYDALKMFRDDNVMYVEVRTGLRNLYDLDGTIYDQQTTAEVYRKAINRFKKDYPDFAGAKIIFASYRKADALILNNHIKLARKVKSDMPEIFAGFDMVGQEDLGYPLIKFVSQLEEVHDLNYFFHAGETNWYGTDSDMNLIDAVLLGAKRIGHAYALIKHPALMAAVKERNIGLEVNVLSNAVLSLVKDIRNHPLSVLLANGMPVVLSSDDPGAWEADGLSDDFYAAFVGAASRLSDLRLLKTLALNSLRYSALEGVHKDKAIRDFHDKWDEFVNGFDCSLY